MKILYFFLVIFNFNIAFGQDVKVKKYSSGQISLKETTTFWPDVSKNFREQKVEVFNKKGGVVYTGIRRNYAGHSSVDVLFHKNGGVSKVSYSSAPDAGIQWYKGYLILDESGNVIEKFEDSHDKQHTLLLHQPEYKHEEIKPIKTQKVKPNECASPRVLEMYFINLTKAKISMLVHRKFSNVSSGKFTVLRYNDTLKVEPFTNSEQFINPNEYFEIFLINKKKTVKKLNFSSFALKEKIVSDSIKKSFFYYVE